ncbi:MAG: ABC transporter ATP-binding protein [Azospirillaceae bacterium]
MTALLNLTGIVAGYGPSTVLQGIDLAVREGTITAVIGSNGAGKTTLMRVLAGLIPARAGAIRLDGRDIVREPTHKRVEQGLVLVPEGRLVFPDIAVEDTLRLGAFSRRARGEREATIEAMFQLFPRLKERRRQVGGSLSGGEQQMLALARGLMARPRLLLLDEPSLGLAPKMADLVFETVATIRDQGVTVLIVEQDVETTLGIADDGYVLENGTIATAGRASELLAMPDIRERILGL